MYGNSREACKHFGVSSQTLRRWTRDNKIRSRRNPSGHHMYLLGKDTDDSREGIIYCRVSSNKQKEDLERQVRYLSDKYPEHRIVRDVGSGINFKRKGFVSLLGSVADGRVSEIVVASKDRMCRFAFEIIEWLCKRTETKIVVLDTVDKTPEEEFTEDILAILQVFGCRWNGRRRYKHQEKKGLRGEEDQGVSDDRSEIDDEEDGGDV